MLEKIHRSQNCQIGRPLSRIEEDGRNWLRRPELCITICRGTTIRERRREIRIYIYIYIYMPVWKLQGADKSLTRPGRKQARGTEDFYLHISYLLS